MASPRDVVQYQDIAEAPSVPAQGGGGWTSPPSPGRAAVQYQVIAEPFEITNIVAEAGTLDAVMVLPGLVLDYQALTEPLAVPPAVAPTVPDGVAAYLTVFPDPARYRRLPEMGTPYVFLLPLEVSGSALSWVPVYHGLAGLPPQLQQFHPADVYAFIQTPGAPVGFPTWGAIYPSMVGRTIRDYPNVGESFTWSPTPVAPLGAVTRQQHLDLRRRQLLLIRRLVR